MRRLLSFLTGRDGSIAVEFAFVAPVMLAMIFGLSDLALALGARADVVNLSSAGSDLISQESTATTADMTNVFGALSAMMYPNDPSPVQITISSVIDDNSGGAAGNPNTTGTVAWSCNQGGGTHTHNTNDTYSFPASAQGVIASRSGTSVIVTEIYYTYPMPVTIPGVINSSYVLSNVFYSKPRRVTQIPLSGGCP